MRKGKRDWERKRENTFSFNKASETGLLGCAVATGGGGVVSGIFCLYH
jgi:hypothetical protein